MFSDLQKAQEAVIRTIARAIPEEWHRVVVNFEMAEGDDGVQHDMLGFYIVKDKDGKFAKRELEFTAEVQRAFTTLNDMSLKTNKQYWSTCDLVVDSSGKYKFDFSFAPPKRINGIIDEDSYYRFGKYLETYTAERK